MNTAGEPQDMEGELDIDTTSDSESESEFDPESSTGSGSLSENNSAKEVKLGKKRKMKKRNCTTKKRQAEGTKVPIETTSGSESESEFDPESSIGSDSLSENNSAKEVKLGKKRKMKKRNCTTKKRQAEGTKVPIETTSGSESESEFDPESSTGSDSLSENNSAFQNSSLCFRQKFGNKSELPVTCGDKDGVLHVVKYNDMEKCIFSEGQWFKPNEFERFGGKERSKKWKTSIFWENFPLQKLIEAGCLSSFKQSQIKNKQIDTPESSLVADRLIKRKCQRPLFPSCSESNGRNDDDNGKVVDENDEDIIDMTVFEGPTLPVTCGSGSGILHKYRFATGRCGRCIRTKDFWLTPEDFIRVSKPEGTWRKDILSNGEPLGKLIMKSVLELHMINCDCKICKDLEQYLNDDVCFVCDSEGDLVCCDECPRAFHSHCHLPAVREDSPGQWSCTFCVMKKMKSSNQKTQQDILSIPVSQYTLHCQYLLLHLLHESMTDPCAKVPGFSGNICGPMMLGRVKLNLENNDYQTVQEFVTDIELIFNNCCTSSEDSDSSRMTSRLKEVFKRKFETVFKLL
ncbi:nuclear body protein SP140-like isoform X4 [Sinocyclocheilus grahami]|uniref:nuclear body protein SP140-like isoform X4 n=1 Tax=Sinocyclocheilus grahami TaxID=75366 RepID=UPI0007AC5E45|nr:PREDICTED: nuclear body protein SP140-like isoform X4 [Sinocyclocheilus grahami]